MLLGDWIILGAIICYIAFWIYLSIDERRRERRQAETYEAAQAFELAYGVTLPQGIQAFFGEEGYWLPSSDYVLIVAGDWPEQSAYLRYVAKENQVKVLRYGLGRQKGPGADPWKDPQGDPDELIGLMVQAARKQRSEAPW